MSDTPRLALPLLAAAQAQKHVTHNEALLALDALVHLHVLDRDLTAPPADPADGDTYIVAAGASGAWAGEEGSIAYALDGGWRFLAPFAGLVAHLGDEATLIFHDGSGWQDISDLLSLQDLPLLGLGTQADATNPLAAKLNDALFTAREVAEGGDGSLRFKLNKEGVGDTVSQLYQSGYSGRAETGLAGDDDFVVKVSPDGATWHEAMRAERTTGRVFFAGGGVRESLSADRTYHVDGAAGSDGNDGRSPATAFATIQKALDTVAAIDLGGHDATISVADGTYAENLVLKPLIGGTCMLVGNTATPASVVLAPAAGAAVFLGNASVYALSGLRIAGAGILFAINATAGELSFEAIDFGAIGAAGSAHVYVQNTAVVAATGDYAITGGAEYHLSMKQASSASVIVKTVTITGTPAFSGYFARVADHGTLRINSNTFAGAATGARYLVEGQGLILTAGGGASYLPGNANGSAIQGGLYV